MRLTTVTLDTDTTVHSLYGQQMGGRQELQAQEQVQAQSTQPILKFLAETREYLTPGLHNFRGRIAALPTFQALPASSREGVDLRALADALCIKFYAGKRWPQRTGNTRISERGFATQDSGREGLQPGTEKQKTSCRAPTLATAACEFLYQPLRGRSCRTALCKASLCITDEVEVQWSVVWRPRDLHLPRVRVTNLTEPIAVVP